MRNEAAMNINFVQNIIISTLGFILVFFLDLIIRFDGIPYQSIIVFPILVIFLSIYDIMEDMLNGGDL